MLNRTKLFLDRIQTQKSQPARRQPPSRRRRVLFEALEDRRQLAAWATGISGGGGDYGHSIATDGNGNTYVTGSFTGTVDFDPGPGVTSFTSAPSGDIYGWPDAYVAKYSEIGALVWVRRFGGNLHDAGSGITLDSTGNVYTTGNFTGTVDFDPGSGVVNLAGSAGDSFVSKLDNNGNFVWAKRLGGSGDEAGHAIALDSDSNVYTTGAFSSVTADFDPGSGVFNLTNAGSAGSYDTFVSKLDSSGNFVWAQRLGGTSEDQGRSIAVDGAGNVHTVGVFRSSNADFDPGSGVFNLSAAISDDVFISKLDTFGNFVWAKRFGSLSSEAGQDIALDSAGNVYTSGLFSGTVDFDPGSGVVTLARDIVNCCGRWMLN